MTRYTETLKIPDSLDFAPGLVTVHDGLSFLGVDSEGSHQEIGTSIVMPEKLDISNQALVVVLSQWSEYSSRRPQLDRLSAISAELGVPAIAIDMPGQSPNSSNLTKSQYQALIKGDYSPLAASLWEAAGYTAEAQEIDITDREVVLVGMSQGGPQAAAMAAYAPEGIAVSDVVLWNSPSVYSPFPNRDGLALAHDFVRYSATDLQYYAELNPQWAYEETIKDGVRILKHPFNHGVTAVRGMAKTNDSITMYDALKSGDLEARIHIVHSSEDAVSPSSCNHAAEEYLKRIARARGNIRRLEQVGEFHGITNYLGAVASVLSGVVRAQS